MTSRPYRKFQLVDSDGHSETSITTCSRQRAAASIFSATTLDEISNLSQFSLPIFIPEITHSGWYLAAIGPPAIVVSKNGLPIYVTRGLWYSENILVRFASDYNRPFSLDIEPHVGIRHIKEMVREKLGVPEDEQMLLFCDAA